MNKLAIVIPAYKKRYFDQTLESFANQTCKDFTIYVGDDASPEDLEEIVNKYKSRISIIYHRFSSNLGGKDLIAHWERCVLLVKKEPWIWFFSDDDFVSKNCVEGFFETLELYKDFDNLHNKVLRFNLVITDKDLYPIKKYMTPCFFSVEYFLEQQFVKNTLVNRAVEFIFSQKTFFDKNKFVNFPLAWGSDKATILKFAQSEGFITISKGEVLWRSSDFNISGNSDQVMNDLKEIARNERSRWMFRFILSYRRSDFFYNIAYRIMHDITINQAFNILKDSKDFLLRFNIFMIGLFIKIKKNIKYTKIKKTISYYLGT